MTRSDFYKILRYLKKFITKQLINNYFNTSFNKNVLISYIISPFINGVNNRHTNNQESLAMAEVFRDLDFNVDIVNFFYEGQIDYTKYDIIIGFGEPLINFFYQNKNNKCVTIYYGTGMHICRQNDSTLDRAIEVFNKKGVWLLDSCRIVDKAWTIQTKLVDSMIIIGGHNVEETYLQYFHKPIYHLPVTFIDLEPNNTVFSNKNFNEAKRHFLYFGSGGFIHKGVDLLLEIFGYREDIELHICGPITKEKEFEKAFYNELHTHSNIHLHGFVDITSKIFEELITKCAFTIFPSCAEGVPSAIINLMMNGLLPIIPIKNMGIEQEEFIINIESLDIGSISATINDTLNIDPERIKRLAERCIDFTKKNYSLSNYRSKLKDSLITILESAHKRK